METIEIFGSTAALFLAVIVAPAVAICIAGSTLRSAIGWTLPVALTLQYLCFLAISALLYGFIPFGIPKLILSIGLATTATWIVLNYVVAAPIIRIAHDTPIGIATIILLALLAAVSIAPDIYYYASIQYPPESGGPMYVVYSDVLRDGHLVRALLRGTQSVYFPNSWLVYEVLWHHGVANLAGALPLTSVGLPTAAGAILVTGFLLYFLLYWSILTFRPNLANSPLLLVLVAILATSNMDWYGLLFTPQYGGPGSIVRYFSIRFLTSTAPQHSTFVISMLPAIVFGYGATHLGAARIRQRAISPRLATIFMLGSMVASPTFTALLLPPLIGSAVLKMWGRWQELARLGARLAGLIALAIVFFWLIMRFPPWDLFIRPGLTSGTLRQAGLHPAWQLPDLGQRLARFPFIFVMTLGVNGALLTIILVWAVFKNRSMYKDVLVLNFMLGILLWNLLLVQSEIQRHYSMVAAILALILLALFLPRDLDFWGSRHKIRKLIVRAGLLIVASITAAQPQFYKTSPDQSSGALAAHDYFCINDIIATRYPNLPVVAGQSVVIFPIAAEVTAVLMPALETIVHQHLTSDQALKLASIIQIPDGSDFKQVVAKTGGRIRRDLSDLGFRAIIWGPWEEILWADSGSTSQGNAVRDILIGSGTLMARCGSVSLFTLAPYEKVTR